MKGAPSPTEGRRAESRACFLCDRDTNFEEHAEAVPMLSQETLQPGGLDGVL